jgi:signal transduction histidine kinase
MTTESRYPPVNSQERDTHSEDRSAVPAPDERINILIVDDEPKNLTVLESVLDHPRYRLVRASSADEALMALVAEDFALLVLDINMPDMNGFELAQMVKSRKRSASIPIIFLTAYYSEDQHVLEGYSTGAVDYLHKPINSTILRSKVAVFADLYCKSRECEVVNRSLTVEVAEHRRAQDDLRQLTHELEQRVAERTEELLKSNTVLTATILELTQAEDALRRADRQKDEFLATLAHELRNPLAPIRNAVQILHLKSADVPELQWAKEVIDRQAQQMTRLVDDLLDISRITTGKLALQKEPIELEQIVRAAIETSQPLVEACGQQLAVELPPEPLILSADSTRLAQALSNLLNNAAKFMERGGQIRLHVERQGAEVEISVKDTGVGIPPEILPYVFDMFTQGERNLNRSQGGLGIGLTLVRKLVQLHGGSIQACSAGHEKGSEFIVRLPLLVEPYGGSHKALQVAPNNCETRLRILVADDNRDSADSLQMLLRIMGNDVRTAQDGLEAIQRAEQFRPDIVLLDIGMPNMNGYDACRSIREQPWGKGMVIVAQTGWGQDEDRRRSRDAGFDHHLIKPVDQAKLSALLTEIASQRARVATG